VKAEIVDLLSIAYGYYSNCDIEQEEIGGTSCVSIKGKNKSIEFFFDNTKDEFYYIVIVDNKTTRAKTVIKKDILSKAKELLLDKRMQDLINN